MIRPCGHFIFAGTPRNSQHPDTALERRPGSRSHSTSRNERKAPVHEESLPARREKSEDRGEPDHDPRLSRSRSRQRLGALFHPRGANETMAADGPAVKVSGFYLRRPPPSRGIGRGNADFRSPSESSRRKRGIIGFRREDDSRKPLTCREYRFDFRRFRPAAHRFEEDSGDASVTATR